uniref:60S ribosomal protein L6 n=1 Tax=Lotharella oceanica TaxID=641309 RepID=A0A7S2TQA9_9EUKA|mmetsp:Transcript_25137/g.46925  ORF Transcript_25137/g.46925 Transcript_25137/m.46925 type:complete len:197 (+) Transcript_25137:41-631(+)|eukprot:CAMPEP_0170167206 /NCGR_PEP_ID=MMETSP0040_2-20121228/685_1 /TAXON_ID=641309 /ORGANISM="Lotharella oceanica, Strain CCMP622" /LENGTH=196 /DNA_ID=CAMNT_0010405165 /DNA_START=41 /DNA_END=631 /DNA_ORIENTATION=+
MPKQKKAPVWYPTEDGPEKKLTKTIQKQKRCKLRPSIVPGTVLILLAGRFKGKRVVFLKQLYSGLLLVTGPFKINGVPLRRVNQAYVIATSTKIDVSAVDTAGINDEPSTTVDEKTGKKTVKHFFSRVVAEAKEDGEGEFVTAESKKPGLTKERKDAQAKVDAAVTAAVEKTPMMKDYLKSKFSLEKGQYPHLMKF